MDYYLYFLRTYWLKDGQLIMILYSGLMSKGCEDIVSSSTDNCWFRPPHCRLMPLLREHLQISVQTFY